MTREHAERYILTENRRTLSSEDQVDISHAMWDEDITPTHDGIKSADIEDRLDLDLEYNVDTSIDHLEEADMVEGTAPDGPDFYAISERLDDIVNGEVDEVAEEDIELVIGHMQEDDPVSGDGTTAIADGGGATVRGVLSDEFDVVPDAMEDFLRDGDQFEKLNQAVDAIRDHDGVEARDDYGKIVIRRGAFRYTLTPHAVDLYTREADG